MTEGTVDGIVTRNSTTYSGHLWYNLQ